MPNTIGRLDYEQGHLKGTQKETERRRRSQQCKQRFLESTYLF
jgi:hypothetical protein